MRNSSSILCESFRPSFFLIARPKWPYYPWTTVSKTGQHVNRPFGRIVASAIAKWTAVAKAANIEAD